MKTKTKVIPSPVDVVGRKVSWKPNKNCDRLFGEVVRVQYKPVPDERYPNTCLRKLKTFISVMLGDGRILVMSGEMKDLKKINMIVDTE